jgi:Na+/melibiose symporter-like transporter
MKMRVLLTFAGLAIGLATPTFAQQQSQGSGMSNSGSFFAGLTLVGTLLAVIYAVLTLFMPIFVYVCMRRLTQIRNELQALRQQQWLSIEPKTAEVTPQTITSKND